MPLIVSLSSIPPRFGEIDDVLQALLAQDAAIEEIRLYIPKRYRRFPDYDGSLPSVPRGIRIIQPDEDLGPASKVLFAADELRGTDCNIIYCDDDRYYHRSWFSRMLAGQVGHEDKCITTCHLKLSSMGFHVQKPRKPQARYTRIDANRIVGLTRRKIKQFFRGVTDRKPPKNMDIVKPGFADIAEGCGAVLVKPDFFDAACYDLPAVLWTVDDVWLSGHMERRGIPIWNLKGFGIATPAEVSSQSDLYSAVIDGAGRADANKACVRYMQDTYGIWR